MNNTEFSYGSSEIATICLPEQLISVAEDFDVQPGELAQWIIWEFQEQPDFFEEAAKNLKIFVEEEEEGC